VSPVFAQPAVCAAGNADGGATVTTSNNGRGRFDPQFCQRVVLVGAIICLAPTLCAGILFATSNPSKCPDWTYPGVDGKLVAIWPAIVLTGLWTLVVSYHAITWKRFEGSRNERPCEQTARKFSQLRSQLS
jgi:hypothetical protein